ncbi:MAG TPA: 2-oxoacid:acceptor oxidoreductase family protein [Tissierellaceae bacterium]|nr:2-oxoacid:acceptor oxidoreductase family protein [Tissierellaceae bacterium]
MTSQQLRLTGSGGQGLILAGIILAEAALFDGKNVVQSQSYGPEARGGASRAEIIISTHSINYPKVDECDIMLALTQDAYDKYIGSLKSGGILVLDSSVEETINNNDITTYNLPILDTAVDKIGKSMVANIIALGSIYELTKIVSKESLIKAVCGRVPRGTEELNEKALEEGINLIKSYRK